MLKLKINAGSEFSELKSEPCTEKTD